MAISDESDSVPVRIGDIDLDLDVGIFAHELAQGRGHVAAAEAGGCGDLELALGLGHPVVDAGPGRLDLGEDAFDVGKESRPFLRNADAACCAIEQPR